MILFNVRKSEKGFTLIELVVVIAVIAILTAIAVPAFSGIINSANSEVNNTNIRLLNLVGNLYVAKTKPVAGAMLTSAELGAWLYGGAIPNKASTTIPFTVKVNATATGVLVS